MVAFCRWIYPRRPTDVAESETEKPALPDGPNVKLISDFFTKLEVEHIKDYYPETMYCKLYLPFP
jgi:hypothetical protein